MDWSTLPLTPPDIHVITVCMLFLCITIANEPCRDNGGCSDICAVVDGDIQCSCAKGFRLDDADKASCIGK